VSEEASPGRERLHTYLNDHLAGSVAAIELFDNLIEHHSEDRFAKTVRDLRDEIQADRETLRNLLGKLGAEDPEKITFKVAQRDPSASLGMTRSYLRLLPKEYPRWVRPPPMARLPPEMTSGSNSTV